MPQLPYRLLHNKRFQFLIYTWLTLVSLAGILVTYIESFSPNAKIKNVFDGIWWAVVTVTTVGYGDFVPVTFAGRILAIFLILLGTTILYSFIFMFISLSITDSQDQFQNKRLLTRLEEIEKKLSDIQKKQHYLILKKTQKK